MAARVPSGDDRLDEVLGGGLLRHSIALVSGAPGTGKSLLAQQYLFANAHAGAHGVYVSTVSEPLDKTVRFAQELSFFDVGAVGRSVWYLDGGAVLRTGGLDGLLRWLVELLAERSPALLVLDSLKAVASYGQAPDAFPRFLSDLAATLATTTTTTLWLSEHVTRSDATASAEAGVADAIVHLSNEGVKDRELRLCQVLKLRGSGFASGRHAYRLDAGGMHVFPRLAVVQRSERPSYDTRADTGVRVLDDMLGGGYPRGSSTLVAGPTGSGKTLLGLHFLAEGARTGEPGVLATLQDSPQFLARRLSELDPSLDEGSVAVLYRSPVDVYVDQWVYDVLDLVERQGARRVVIDGLMDLQLATDDPIRFREYLSSLVERFAVAGITAVLTHELALLFRIEELHTEAGYSNLADSIVLLQYLMGPLQLRRALTVLKTQGAAHDMSIRSYTISSTGMDLGDPLGPRGEVMSP